MMRPEKVSFYVYAENTDEAASLERALREFVQSMYSNGGLVTAELLTDALRKYKDNYFVRSYFRGRGH